MQEKTKLTRYCPECGHVGDVSATHISCCPDGSAAFDVPTKYAQELRNGFKALIAKPKCLHQIQEPASVQVDARDAEWLTTEGRAHGFRVMQDIQSAVVTHSTASLRSAIAAAKGQHDQ